MKHIQLQTNHGVIKLELNEEKAPKTVKNFIDYVENGHYDNTIFHRVIDNFMIQGGGFDASMKQKETQKNIENEANNGLKNDYGTIAMARTSDPHSASSQFFINVKDNDFLNFTSPTTQGWGYCVFGKVIEGLDVIDLIRQVKTGSKHAHQDVPVENVMIEKATIASLPDNTVPNESI